MRRSRKFTGDISGRRLLFEGHDIRLATTTYQGRRGNENRRNPKPRPRLYRLLCNRLHYLGSDTMQYFVVMIDYGRRGREAIVDPEITRRGVIERIASGEYKNILFVHSIHDGVCEDVTNDVLTGALEIELSPVAAADRQAWAFDRARALRNEVV